MWHKKYQNIHQSITNHSLNYQPVHHHNTALVFSSAIRSFALALTFCLLQTHSACEAAGITVWIKDGNKTPHSCSCKAARPEPFCFTLHTDLEANIFPTTSPNWKHFQKSEAFTEHCFGKASSHGSVGDISHPLQFSLKMRTLSNSSKLHVFADVNWAQGIPRSNKKVGNKDEKKIEICFPITLFLLSIKTITSSRF